MKPRIVAIVTVFVGLVLPRLVVASSAEETVALFAIDSAPPMDLRIDEASAVSIQGVRCVTVRYRSPAGGDVTADLFVPPGDGPFAGVLVMHGLPGNRQQVRDLAAALASLGAVALAVDAPFARRRGPPIRWDERDRSEQIQLIRDLRRGVDLLLARDDVDGERLGYFGASYGGAMGGLLAGVERRLKAYVLLVGDGGVVTHYTGPEDRGGALDQLAEEERRAWLEQMWPIEPIHFVGRAAPAKLLFVNGRRDRLVPERDAHAYQEAGSEPKTVRWYDAGHLLTGRAMEDTLEWIADALGLDPPRRRRLASRTFRSGAREPGRSTVDRVRYVLAVILVVSWPPGVLLWIAIHPFVRFWRKVGAAWSYVILAVPLLLVVTLVWRWREPLLGVDLGTSYPLIALAVATAIGAAILAFKRRKYLTFRILAGVPEISRGAERGTLLREGIYGVIRHPRYVEALLAVAAYTLFSNYLGLYVLLALSLPAVYLVVVLEERELRDRFGSEYESYCREVPRFLPRSWRDAWPGAKGRS